jgi:hypothetical protein
MEESIYLLQKEKQISLMEYLKMEMNLKKSHTLSLQIIMMIRLGNLKKFTSIQKRNQKGDKVISKKMNK